MQQNFYMILVISVQQNSGTEEGSWFLRGYEERYKDYLFKMGKSKNTIKTYLLNVHEYFRWFQETYDTDCKKLYRENVLEYKAYLLNVERYKGKNLNGKTVNGKLSALYSFNKFLIVENVQEEIVLGKTDFVKVQIDYVNRALSTKLMLRNLDREFLKSKTDGYML